MNFPSMANGKVFRVDFDVFGALGGRQEGRKNEVFHVELETYDSCFCW